MRRIILLIVCVTVLMSVGVRAESSSRLNPQVIVLSQKAAHYSWHQGMTLAEVITKFGGFGEGSLYLVRRAAPEKLRIPADLNRTMEAWDVVVIGDHSVSQ